MQDKGVLMPDPIQAKSMSEFRRLQEQGANVLPPKIEKDPEDFPLGAACDPSKMEECESCQ
jgi:hypothetical protein